MATDKGRLIRTVVLTFVMGCGLIFGNALLSSQAISIINEPSQMKHNDSDTVSNIEYAFFDDAAQESAHDKTDPNAPTGMVMRDSSQAVIIEHDEGDAPGLDPAMSRSLYYELWQDLGSSVSDGSYYFHYYVDIFYYEDADGNRTYFDSRDEADAHLMERIDIRIHELRERREELTDLMNDDITARYGSQTRKDGLSGCYRCGGISEKFIDIVITERYCEEHGIDCSGLFEEGYFVSYRCQYTGCGYAMSGPVHYSTPPELRHLG